MQYSFIHFAKWKFRKESRTWREDAQKKYLLECLKVSNGNINLFYKLNHVCRRDSSLLTSQCLLFLFLFFSPFPSLSNFAIQSSFLHLYFYFTSEQEHQMQDEGIKLDKTYLIREYTNSIKWEKRENSNKEWSKLKKSKRKRKSKKICVSLILIVYTISSTWLSFISFLSLTCSSASLILAFTN